MSLSRTKLETLALHGGIPVREKLLPYGRQSLADEDIQAVVNVLKSDWLTTGPNVDEFETTFAEQVGAKFAVSFSSGTAALHGAAFAAGLESGDEAITTPMTFCATANCVLYQGATPAFADVCADTLNLDPQIVSRKLTSRTKAIIAVDYAGHPAALEELAAIAKENGALLIEDACHALGAEYRRKRVGAIADMTVFSFHPVKHLTTGEGGMVTTNDPALAETLRRFRNHGISSEARQRQDAGQWFYEMVLLGFNYRLTDIACALGLSQLARLDENLSRRREIAAEYSQAFQDFPVVTPAVRENVFPAWHLFPIRLNLESLSTGRAEIFRALRAENIGVNVHYIPVHLHPYYRKRFPATSAKGTCPVAEDAYERLISLPMFHSMTAQDVADVIDSLHKVLAHYTVEGGHPEIRGTGSVVDLAQGQDVIRLVGAGEKSSVECRAQTLNRRSNFFQGPVVAVIQARMGSSRLPGKSMAEIEGHPMLWHVIERTKRARLIDRVVVATSTNSADDVIEAMCREMGVPCYRGSEHDVLDRFYMAARAEKASQVVRITADCPLIDPEVIDRVVHRFQPGDLDYASNAMVRTYPDGLDTEVFSFSALERAWHEATRRSEREHVTPYLRSAKFRTANVENNSASVYRHYRWTVDEAEDLEFIRAVYRALHDKNNFGMNDVFELLEKNPGLEQLNSDIVSNRGYYKSLFEEAQAAAAPRRPTEKSKQWLKRAEGLIPCRSQTFSEGSNEHVRGLARIFLAKGKGCRVWDVDGNEYIDYKQGFLPNILGYAHDEVNVAVAEQLAQGHSFSLPHPLEVELAERLTRLIPCAEKVRFGKNGSDATSGAIRAARALTGRDRIAYCGYHGWQDRFIGSTTRNAGVRGAVRFLPHTFIYNDLASLQNLLADHPEELAAVMMEPVNFWPPAPGFLEGVKQAAHEHGALLIFDETCSGFYFGLGGAHKRFNVIPDMACFGEAMGNGFPISCIVGSAEVMKVFEDFTIASDVASMAAAMTVLDILETTDALPRMNANGRLLKEGLNSLAKEAGLEDRLQCIGYPSWSLIKFLDIDGKDSFLVRSLFTQECAKQGVLLLATHNITAAHDPLAIEQTLKVYAGVCKTVSQWLSDPQPERYFEAEMIQQAFKVR